MAENKKRKKKTKNRNNRNKNVRNRNMQNNSEMTEAEINKAVKKAYKQPSSSESSKKTWVRVLLIIMAFMMILSFVLLPLNKASAADDGDVKVTAFETGNLSSALTEAMNGVDQNNIYSLSVSGGTLNASDYSAILNLPNLVSIDLSGAKTENGIIPDNAIPARNQMETLSLPSNTTSIGNSAFNNNKKLSKIDVPSTVTSIGSYAFDSCISLTSFYCPEGVMEIGEGAFRDCQSLEAFTLPAGVTEIPAYCFSKCVFTEFYITPNVESIGDGAFSDCHELKDVYVYGDTAPELLGGGVFQNLNVTVHSADGASGFDGWGNNFVSTEEGFNEEYVAPETTVAVTEEVKEADDESEETEAVSEKEEESEETTVSEESANDAEKSDTEKSSGLGVGAVIVIVVLAAALAVCITLLVVKKK